jgi:type 1 fimbria pilin
MKLLALAMMASLMFAGTSFAAQKGQTYTGEITDSACAKMGSHAAMMKQDPTMKTAKSCTTGCVKNGAKYVLYDASTKTVYELDDQKKPERFAGAKVTVTGTLDDATHTIHVGSIKASGQPASSY